MLVFCSVFLNRGISLLGIGRSNINKIVRIRIVKGLLMFQHVMIIW
jgi:hypothetical protein